MCKQVITINHNMEALQIHRFGVLLLYSRHYLLQYVNPPYTLGKFPIVLMRKI